MQHKFLGCQCHYNDVVMGAMASQITSLTIVNSKAYSGADQRKHQSSALLAFVRGIHRWPVNSPHKWPVTRKLFPFDDVIMAAPLIHSLAWRLLSNQINKLIFFYVVVFRVILVLLANICYITYKITICHGFNRWRLTYFWTVSINQFILIIRRLGLS